MMGNFRIVIKDFAEFTCHYKMTRRICITGGARRNARRCGATVKMIYPE